MSDEETKGNELQDIEEVFADAKLTSRVDVIELIDAGKNQGKVFVLILWLLVNVKDK